MCDSLAGFLDHQRLVGELSHRLRNCHVDEAKPLRTLCGIDAWGCSAGEGEGLSYRHETVMGRP
jgi:hypothetical protein